MSRSENDLHGLRVRIASATEAVDGLRVRQHAQTRWRKAQLGPFDQDAISEAYRGKRWSAGGFLARGGPYALGRLTGRRRSAAGSEKSRRGRPLFFHRREKLGRPEARQGRGCPGLTDRAFEVGRCPLQPHGPSDPWLPRAEAIILVGGLSSPVVSALKPAEVLSFRYVSAVYPREEMPEELK